MNYFYYCLDKRGSEQLAPLGEVNSPLSALLAQICQSNRTGSDLIPINTWVDHDLGHPVYAVECRYKITDGAQPPGSDHENCLYVLSPERLSNKAISDYLEEAGYND